MRARARSRSLVLTADSRKVKPGFLFVAIAGAKADGAHFAKQAAAAGAVAVAAEQRPDRPCPDSVAFVRGDNPRRALALVGGENVFPRQPATIAAVTGTSGKTSVVAFTRQIWSDARVSGSEYRHDRRSFARRANATAP